MTNAADQIRRWSNLLLAIAQIAVTLACFYSGTSFDDATGIAQAPDPPIVPAGYAFLIWSVIYAGSLAYGIYQFARSREVDPLMRRTGWWTASGFLGCCVWMVLVRSGHLAWTVPCIYWMAISLFGAFRPLWKLKPVAAAVRWCVVAPISIYAGWLSVAIFANTASEHKETILGQTSGTMALIAAAAVLASIVLRRSAGNVFYGGTIMWALIAIGVRDQFELKNVAVAITAWTCLGIFATMLFLMKAMRRRLPAERRV